MTNSFINFEKRIFSILVFLCFVASICFMFVINVDSVGSDSDKNSNKQTYQKLNDDFSPYEIKSATGEDFIILKGSAEYFELVQSNVIGNNPVIIVGDKGKLVLDGIETNIITDKSFVYDDNPCVIFIELIDSDEETDTFSLKMNEEVTEFKLDKKDNEIIFSDKELNVFIGDNGNWYVNGVDTNLTADDSKVINSKNNKINSIYDLSDHSNVFTNDIHQDNPDSVAKLDNVLDSNIANSKQELSILEDASIDSCNVPSFAIKDSYRSSGWYCDDMLVLLPLDQVYGDRVITYFENMNRASDELIFTSDNVGETNMNVTDLFKATGPRYHDRK